MNQIQIRGSFEGKTKAQSNQSTFQVLQAQANKIIPLLRSDYFSKIIIGFYHKIDPKQLKYIAQIGRLLKEDGEILLENQENQSILKLLKNLGLIQREISENYKILIKNIKKGENQLKNEQKLSIGFKSLAPESKIDEEELLKDEGLQIKKKKPQNCNDKPKACANCSCGRKDNQQILIQYRKIPTKEQLVQSVNSGKALKGCGKCFEGDSARCGSCPYRGLPAFKPGDKLKLAEDGNLVVEEGTVIISAGKVKLQL